MKERITNILLIDDDEDDALLFAGALKEVDPSIKCVFYYDSEKALKDLKSFTLNPDCIFLDLNMPKVNGIEVLKELKAAKRRWPIPIVVCSSTSNKDHIDGAMALGAQRFITKPNSQKELVKEVRAALKSL